MTPLSKLRVTRKTDRAAMVAALYALAAEVGATAEPFIETDEMTILDLRKGGLRVLVGPEKFSLTKRNDVWVFTWNAETGRLNPAVFRDVNPHHGHKANFAAYSFPAALDELRRGFTAADAIIGLT